MRVLFAILLLLPNFLVAQESDSIFLSVDLDDVVVTAQYAPTEARNAVHNVAVINKHEWKEQGVLNLSELLQRQMTFTVNPDPILGNGLAIQGLGGQNVQIMIDGVPVIGRLGGNVDLTQLDLTRFARVEMITGALSARYGSDAAGGVINLITAKEQADNWQLEAGGQYETVDLDQQYFRLGRKLGNFRVNGGVNRYQARFGSEDSLRAGASPWNPKDQLSYDLNLGFKPNDSLQFQYSYRGFDETVSLLGEVRRPQFRPYVVDMVFDTDRQDHALTGSFRLPANLIANITAGWNTFERLRRQERSDLKVIDDNYLLEADTTYLIPGEQDTTRYTGQLLRASLATTHNRQLGGQIGIEYRRETGAGRRILDPNTDNLEPDLVNMVAWLGLTFQPYSDLTVEVTSRFGYHNRYQQPIVPAVNVLWKASPQWRWRASYASSFRAPSVQELFFNFIDINHYIVGNRGLAAERGTNLQLSADWSDRSGTLSLTGEAFLNRLRERISLADLEGDGRFTYVNLTNYETHGLTFQLNYQPNPNLRIVTGGALTRLLNTVAEAEEDTPQFLNLGEVRNEINYTLTRLDLSFRLDHRYIGRRDRYVLDADDNVTQGFIGDYHLL
ncbi:MAG: TonB-dependent receptor, partial [Bacteroidota bacterium]